MKERLKLICWVTTAMLAIYGMEEVTSTYSFTDMQQAINLYYLPILTIYILLICIRGLLFIPTMPIILLMASSIDNVVMLGITLVASCISSYLVCLAVDIMDFKKRLEKLPAKSINKAQEWVQTYGIAAIAGWAFFPFVFTEIIVYLARIAGISKQQIIISVAIGEGIMLCILVYITDWFIKLTVT